MRRDEMLVLPRRAGLRCVKDGRLPIFTSIDFVAGLFMTECWGDIKGASDSRFREKTSLEEFPQHMFSQRTWSLRWHEGGVVNN